MTVSASAYYLLVALQENHSTNSENQLIPHCGTVWGIDDKNELMISACDFGTNWTITHELTKVIHNFGNEEVIETDFEDWKNAVYNFSDKVMHFYEVSSPKTFTEDEDKKAFELFMQNWKYLRAKAFD